MRSKADETFHIATITKLRRDSDIATGSGLGLISRPLKLNAVEPTARHRCDFFVSPRRYATDSSDMHPRLVTRFGVILGEKT